MRPPPVPLHSADLPVENMLVHEAMNGMARYLVLFGLLVLASQGAAADWTVPGELQARVEALGAARRAFIESGAAIQVVPERQLIHELTVRDEDELASLVDDLMVVAGEMGYSPERDMGAAPLNLTSKRFSSAVTTPAALRKMKREAGPFSVHRYLNPRSGVPTFGGAKVAIWPEDLIAGKVDVAIMGVPSDMGSGQRDAASAPDEMRALNTIATPDTQSLVRPFEVLAVVDYGNLEVDRMSVERTVNHVAEMVAETARTGAVPMMVGGDTSMLYPGVKGVATTLGERSFGLLHFSAHPDAERHGDHTISDRQAIFRLLEDRIIDGGDTIQVGLRGPDVDQDTLQWLRDQGVRYHTMAEIRRHGFDKVLGRVRREVERGPNDFFVSVDVSALAPAEMIAAGRVEANGLGIEQLTKAIRHVCAAKNVVGFEITDLAPMMDLSDLSVINANAVLNACLVGIAVRKSGHEPDYVHPLALDHGRR